jgi:hypothetical protein
MVKVEGRIPATIANTARSFALDLFKNQRYLSAKQVSLSLQLEGFTQKAYLVYDSHSLKLIPIYNVPTEECTGTIKMKMTRKKAQCSRNRRRLRPNPKGRGNQKRGRKGKKTSEEVEEE